MTTVAMNSAISGLNSFQTQLNYISDNVANSQSIGFKRIDANFSSYVSSSSERLFNSGGVTVRPSFINDKQGALVQSESNTSIAISGSGWMPVQEGTSSSSGLTGSNETLYTRRGDFALDENAFLKNGANKFLFARSVPAPTAAVPNPQPNQGTLVPVRINQAALPALQTATAFYAANLPSNAPAGTVYNGGTVTMTDATGAARAFSITWYNRDSTGDLPAINASTATGTATIPAPGVATVPQWRAVITAPTSSANGTESLVVDFTFGTQVGIDAGLPTGFTIQSTDNTTLDATTTGTDGRLAIVYSAPGLTATPTQTINLEFGAPNAVSTTASALTQSGGLTSFGGSSISLSRITADGYPSGSYNGVGIDSAGNVYSTYTNGQRRTQYQVALATFNNANGLVRTDGEAFRDDPAAGFIGLNQSLQGGTGSINPNSIENSNVDIGSEFTKMIVAQRSYSANARLITTADEMLQEVVNLKR